MARRRFEDEEAEKKMKNLKPPFKLCFSKHREEGRSNISPYRPLGLVHEVSGKFYKEKPPEPNEEILKEVIQLYEFGPKEKYGEMILESHRYGWYSDVTFTPIEARDKRFNFAIALDDIFKW